MPADLLQKINIPKAICYNKSVRPTYLRCRINAITIVLKYCMVLIRYHFGKNHKDPITTKYLKHCRPFSGYHVSPRQATYRPMGRLKSGANKWAPCQKAVGNSDGSALSGSQFSVWHKCFEFFTLGLYENNVQSF